jgi:hypothetical protein
VQSEFLGTGYSPKYATLVFLKTISPHFDLLYILIESVVIGRFARRRFARAS